MTQYCIMCGKFVEVVPDADIWGLAKQPMTEFEFVCDRCINKKLNFAEPRQGGCLYCKNEPDYNLRKFGTRRDNTGFTFFAKRDSRPMLCEYHFEQLEASEEDDILSIEDALSDEENLRAPELTVPDVIGQEENRHLEYKETFQYNIYTEQSDKSLKLKLAKEIVALGNSEGGIVIIGVRDEDKVVTGLERDYSSMNVEWDGFALQVSDVLKSNIGQAFTAAYTSIEQHRIDESEVCAIRVDPSPNALFTDIADKKKQFYVRQGSSSEPLEGNEMIEYLSNRWEI